MRLTLAAACALAGALVLTRLDAQHQILLMYAALLVAALWGLRWTLLQPEEENNNR